MAVLLVWYEDAMLGGLTFVGKWDGFLSGVHGLWRVQEDKGDSAEDRKRGKVARKLFSKQTQREWRTRCRIM